ncbi:hypothetical protein [Flavobacterium sp. 102]|uniref:hypothetical protein n=1 Tax=Flavobacterium sp. 102 TaxID=2135623 RepID=UPI000EAE1FE0|nr:hypothetical protein [Flavobacterium sp. 102]RKS00426.1 hypothetical protein C8C84_0034 [Flavobacterium sp. 102]
MSEKAKMTIENDHNIKDTVYLVHDVEQKPRMITAIIIQEHHIMYEVISGNEVSNHFGFELSNDKTLHL